MEIFVGTCNPNWQDVLFNPLTQVLFSSPALETKIACNSLETDMGKLIERD